MIVSSQNNYREHIGPNLIISRAVYETTLRSESQSSKSTNSKFTAVSESFVQLNSKHIVIKLMKYQYLIHKLLVVYMWIYEWLIKKVNVLYVNATG